MGLKNDQIDALDVESTAAAEKIIAMLNAWKRQMGEKATRNSLMNALTNANRKDVAEKVRTYKEEC